MKQTTLSRRAHIGMQAGFLAGLLAGNKTLAQGSFLTDLSNIKSSLVRIASEGATIGIGFIGEQDGKQYIFTNASVISGHMKLAFQTLENKAVQPKKIELSSTRDIVRLQVAGEKALKLNPEIVADEVIAVLEYKQSSIKNHGGVITGSSTDMIEIGAQFERDSSGSPLIDSSFGVRGIANHLVYYKAQGKDWKGTPRLFAYKLDGAAWYAASWSQYNKTYGKSLRDVDEFRNIVYAVAADWVKRPKAEIEFEDDIGLDFDRWVKNHNGMISDLSKKKSKGGGNDLNAKMQKRFQESCLALIRICDAKAKHLEFLCEDKKITKYLRIQFKWRALELRKFGRFVTDHAENHARDRWM